MPHKGSNESQIPQKSFENCHQCCQGHQKESKGSKEKFERKRESSLDEGIFLKKKKISLPLFDNNDKATLSILNYPK